MIPSRRRPKTASQVRPRLTQMEDVADTDSVASVATVVTDATPDDLAEEDDRESLWSVGGDLESAHDVEEEILFRHPGVRSCQLGSGRWMLCSCVMHLNNEAV